MAATDLKKYVGIGFIALFSVFLINAIVAKIPLEYDSSLWGIRAWWFIIGSIIQIVAVSYLGFYRKCQSSIISKIGSILYYILMLICLVDQILYKLTRDSLTYIPGVSEYLYSLVLYTPGLLLLVWGSKLWLPSKITLSLIVASNVAGDMIWAIKTASLPFLSYFSTFMALVTLILTVVWISLKSKVPSVCSPQIDEI